MAFFTIGYDASTTLAPRTGIGRAVLELMRAMLEREDERFEFHVLLSSFLRRPGADHEFLHQSPQVKVFRSHRPGSWMVKKWAQGSGPKAESLLGNIGIFHAPASYIPPTDNARRVVSVYDLAFLDIPESQRDPLGGGIFAKHFPKVLPHVEGIVTNASYTKSRLIEEYNISPERIAMIPLAVDREFFQPAEERHVEIATHNVGLSSSDYVFTVTSHQARKRNRLLLETYETLLKKRPETPPLVVLGWDGKAPPELKSRPHLHRHVQVLSRVDEQNLPGLYTGAVVTLLTSAHEGFGFPILEAQSCGSPVICSESSSIPEVGGNGAAYVSSADPEEWAQRVEDIMFDSERRRDFVEAGFQNVDRFSWAKTAEQMMDFYTRI